VLCTRHLAVDKTPFNWTSFWWPVLPIESLDPKLPTHVRQKQLTQHRLLPLIKLPLCCSPVNLTFHASCQVDLLGKSLVVWLDSKGAWQCVQDRCPHKLARLSEGRVEGDNIQVRCHLQVGLRTQITAAHWPVCVFIL
jgi:hypothetical protein